MPDWNSAELKGIKDLIVRYVSALNTTDFDALQGCFAAGAVLHRGMKNYVGREAIIEWFKTQLAACDLKFELADASAGILPDASAKCILWFEIYSKRGDEIKKDIHVENIDLEKTHGHWTIQKCFGLGYDPEQHKKYFGKFLVDTKE